MGRSESLTLNQNKPTSRSDRVKGKPDPQPNFPDTSISQYSIPRSERLYQPERINLPDQKLGGFLDEFTRQETIERRNKWIKRIALASVFALVLALVQGGYGIANFGRAAAIVWSLPYFILTGSFLGIWLILAATTKERKTLIYQHGITLWDSGKPVHTLRWNQIAGVSFLQEEYPILWFKVKVVKGFLFPNQGKPINLAKYSLRQDLPEIITKIKAHVYHYLEPELRKCLRDDRSVYFGHVIVSPEYLGLRDRTFPWSEVTQIDIKNGKLVISIQNQNVKGISLDRIPNVELLLPMAQLARELGWRKKDPESLKKPSL